MDGCAAWNDQHIVDNHVFAHSEHQRRTFSGLPVAQWCVGHHPDQCIFKDRNLGIGVGTGRDLRRRRRGLQLRGLRSLD